jgi:dolichol-phosphate mannosyltransferase
MERKMDNDMEKRALVVIPTYNERSNLPKITKEVLDSSEVIDILIIDDNSPDQTGQIADKLAGENDRVKVIHRMAKLGLGSAYIEGFKFALKEGYDYVFEMDADFSHDPTYLKDFLEAIQDNHLVIGSRYLRGVNVVNWPMLRLIISYCAGIYTRLITGLPIRDPTSGFKCFRREVLESIDLDRIYSDGYSFQIEMNYRCWRRGFRIREIPIIFIDRNSGSSKMNRRIIVEAIFIVWWLRIQSILNKI